MDFLFGADMPLAVRFFFAFIIVLGLIGGTFFLVRRFGAERLGASSTRGRQPRLAVIDAAAVDGRRRLILIRRDNVEHLVMIGGPTDVVVEANIVRAATAAPHATGPRPPAAPTDTLPRAVPLGEGNMWPLQPTPEPAPAPRPPRQPATEESLQWHAEPEPPPLPPRRPEPRQEHRHEPRHEPRQADPLAGLAAELSRVQAETPPAKPRPSREIARTRPSERPRAAPTTAAGDEFAPNADQNLADMAQRLEAALRRPKPAEPRAPDAMLRTSAMTPPAMPEPMVATAPMMAPAPMAEAIAEPQAETTQQAPEPVQATPARAAAKPAAQKSVYDSLEQEMASLLGRPNNKT
jgi:flagellar biogenesis protein FliO